jgi:signal transduction histidine kinase/CheY-like chemotaxis protein
MTDIRFSLDDLPDAAILAARTGRVLAANDAAKRRHGQAAALGAFAPWFDARHGWSLSEREDGTTLGLFRPDADETARAKTMLFATLSHEIRTPLNGILGMAGLLGMSELSSAQRSWLGAVQDSGQHLLGLLNDILDYAKLESGRIELETLVFDPERTLQSVAELCSPRAHEKGLEIAVVAEAGVPAQVAGDDGRLRQILLNLASNAVKFTQSGGILLTVAPAGPNRLRFTVADTGIGIPDDKRALVFEEFAQADSSHTRQFGGTGLGLAIVKKLAHAMGGSVGLDARPGGGSVFHADIPLETITPAQGARPALKARTVGIATGSDVLFEAVAKAIAREGGRARRLAGPADAKGACALLLDHDFVEGAAADWIATGAPVVALIAQERRDLIDTWRDGGAAGYLIKPLRRASLIERLTLAADRKGGSHAPKAANDERADPARATLGLRVLLAEDNPVNALLAKSLLTRSGCDVVAVGNGAEAVAALEAAPYDLVLMDVHMPVMDGFDATRALRAHREPRVARTPVIALTAAAMEEDRRACQAAGMNDFVTKPLDPEMLANVLSRWTNAPDRGTVAA